MNFKISLQTSRGYSIKVDLTQSFETQKNCMLYMWRNRTEVDNLLRGPSQKDVDFVEVVDNTLTEKQRFDLRESVRRSALSFLVLRKQKIGKTQIADLALESFRANYIDGPFGARKRINLILDDKMCQLAENYPPSDAVLVSDAAFFATTNLFFVVDYTDKEDIVSRSLFLNLFFIFLLTIFFV